MTVAPRRPALLADDLEAVARLVRERGGRLSLARRRVWEVLAAASGPISAEEVAHRTEPAPADASSVYRNLEFFESVGLVRHVHLGHGPGLYALEDGRDSEYLVCERCGRVDAVEAEQLDEVRALIRSRFGYEARFSHFPVAGLCGDCS